MSKSNNKGGKGGRRRGNYDENSELIVKEEGQEYALVLRMLGNGRLEAQCFDGVTRICEIRGNMRKKIWINNGDFILVSLRDYQDSRGDVIMKYSADDARKLKSRGELPDNVELNKSDKTGNDIDDIPFDFGDL